MFRFSSLRGAERRSNMTAFILGGIVSTELMWIIRTGNQRADFERKVNAEIAVTENIIKRIKNNEKVDVDKELLHQNKTEDEDLSVESIMSSIQEMDKKWGQASSNILKEPENTPSKPAAEKGKWI